MDWQSVLKYNPNHDPKDGRFTFAGHGGAALDSPFERAFRRVSEAELHQAVDRYENEQDLRGLVSDKYQGKSAYAIVKALQEAHPHLTFRNMEWMHPFALREVATQIDRMANSHPDAFAALDTIGMQETADSVFAATGNHAGAWAAMEHGHMRFNPRYFDMGSNLITDGRHRDDLLTTPVTRAGSLLMELREAEEAGYHPLGNDTVGSIFVHEFGHHVQAFEQGELDYLGKRTKRNGKLLTQRLRQEVDSDTAISTYAAVNDREWFAEAFAATYSHDKPKEIRESGRTSIKSIKGIFDHYFNEYDTFARGQPRTKKEDLAQADLDRGGRLPPTQGPKKRRGFKRIFQYGEGLVTAITKMNPNHDPKTGRFTEKATAFMQEWIEGSHAHPFDDRQRLRRNVGIEMSPWQGMDQVHLSSIISYGSKGKGEASELMREITQMADEHGVAIDLNAKPIPDAGAKGKGLTKAQLVAWYKRHGFKQSPGYGDPSYLTRFPRTTAQKYNHFHDPKTGRFASVGHAAFMATFSNPDVSWDFKERSLNLMSTESVDRLITKVMTHIDANFDSSDYSILSNDDYETWANLKSKLLDYYSKRQVQDEVNYDMAAGKPCCRTSSPTASPTNRHGAITTPPTTTKAKGPRRST
jgi:hypothetical protein